MVTRANRRPRLEEFGRFFQILGIVLAAIGGAVIAVTALFGATFSEIAIGLVIVVVGGLEVVLVGTAARVLHWIAIDIRHIREALEQRPT